MWYWHKDRYIHHRKRIEHPKINPPLYSQLIFDESTKTIQSAKDGFLNTWCWENWISTRKRMNLHPYLTPSTKVHSKGIKDINARSETIKLLKQNIWQKLYNIGFGNDFLNTTPKSQATKEKIDKLDLMEIKKRHYQRI